MIRLSVTAAETASAAAEAAAEAAAAALNAERTPLHSKDVPNSLTDAAQATRADCDRRDRARRDAIEAVAEEAADQRQELTMQLKAKLETLLSSMSTQ